MAIYDPEEIKDREGQAASGAPSSTGDQLGEPNDHDPKQDTDEASSARGRRQKSDAGGGLAKQLLQQESKLPGMPGGSNLAGLGGAFLGGGAGTALKALSQFFGGSNRRKAATAGGTASAFVVIAIMWIVNFSTAPFTFVHIGQILAKHFEPGQHQAEKRMGKLLFEMIYDPPEDVKNPIGDNRLSFLGYLVKNRTLGKLNAQGMKPLLKDNGFSFDGFSVDPKNDNSPYKQKLSEFEAGGADEAKALEELKDFIKLNMDPNGKLGLSTEVLDGKIIVRGKSTLFSDTGIKAMSDVLVSGDHPFFDPIFDAIRVRNLSRWTISGNMHFISRLNAKVTAAKDAWLKENIYDPIKNGLRGNTSDGVAVEGKDANGNPTETPLEGGEGPLSESAAKGFLSDPKGFASVAGGVAAAAAVICILKAINEAVGMIRYAQIFLPMMRWASIMLSIPSQVQTGQDVDTSEMRELANNTLTAYDKNGNETSTWYDAMSIRATAGDSGGIDMNQALKDMMHSTSIPWLAWTNSGAVNTLCSGAVQLALTGISLALLLVPGVDVINAAIGVVVFGAISTAAVNILPGIIAGNGINILARGAEWGNYLDYGARGMASEKNLQEGGVVITQQEENKQLAEVNALNREQFHNESLADRIFNVSDYRSVVGSMIDHAGVYSMQDLVAKVGSIPNILGSLFSLPGSIMFASAHAAAPYQYPFPSFGFSDAEVDDPIVNQPFANADVVTGILDNEESSGDHTYIDKALNCFGVSITKGDQGWQAVPSNEVGTNGQERTYGVNPYDTQPHYDQGDCIGAGDTNWLRIRTWIFDLSNAEGLACSQGDQTSCENSGFASATSNNGTAVNGVKFFSENDPRWANYTIWTGKTMSDDGCVLAAQAMVISTLTGHDVTPVELDQQYGGIMDPFDHFGLHSSGGVNLPATPENLQKVVDAVKGGAVVMVYANWDSLQPFWGTKGHAEVIRGIAPDGNLLVYDPWDMPDSSNPYVPDPKYPNDQGQHGAKEWSKDNFLNSNIRFSSPHPDQAGMEFDIVTK